MKKILSQSPFFLIFFGIFGYLIYNANFDKKMNKLDKQIEDYCIDETGYSGINAFYSCTKRKWEEVGLYEKYVNWKVNKNMIK
tara:strand:+ start:238 stop:486 length:249 start_codon:yes stop_codon:yes gene_type:complete